ncbi:MAG: hypothetical protein H7835_00170 [Magnetococcus sp. XQGC-1]
MKHLSVVGVVALAGILYSAVGCAECQVAGAWEQDSEREAWLLARSDDDALSPGHAGLDYFYGYGMAPYAMHLDGTLASNSVGHATIDYLYGYGSAPYAMGANW